MLVIGKYNFPNSLYDKDFELHKSKLKLGCIIVEILSSMFFKVYKIELREKYYATESE